MQEHPTRKVLLYLDEHLVGRYPTVARCYSSTGAPGMPARQYAGYNSMLRIVGCLDAASGAVIAKRYGSVTVDNSTGQCMSTSVCSRPCKLARARSSCCFSRPMPLGRTR